MGHPLFDLSGKTAVVVGGTSGIGLAMAIGLAEAGADVVASSRRAEQVDEAAKAIEAKGRKSLRLTSDVGDRSSLEALLSGTLKEFGKVDILINCAGKIKREPTLTVTEETWDDIMDTNVTGTLRACQIFGKHMLERRYGRDHQHRVAEYVCEPEGGDGVCGEQGGGGSADQVAGGGVEFAGRDGECDCAGRVSDGAESEAAG